MRPLPGLGGDSSYLTVGIQALDSAAMPVARETLYQEIWAEPVTVVAKRYEVSSSFLARVCERLNVPNPPRGYWQQLKVGKAVDKPGLPELRAGDEIEWARDGIPRVHKPAALGGGVRGKPKKREERPARHRLLVAVRESFDGARVSREGYLKPYKRNIVDIFVSKDTVKRVLDLANEVFLALEDCGHTVSFQPPDARYDREPLHLWDEGTSRNYYDHWGGPGPDTIALVKGVAIGLTLFEISAEFGSRWDTVLNTSVKGGPPRHPKPGEPYDHRIHSTGWFPSGRLGLRAYAARAHIKWDRYWRESKPGDLAATVPEIVKDLERAVPVLEKIFAKKDREDAEWRRKRDEEHRVWAIKETERRRVEHEAQREKAVTETLAGWRAARDVRAYVTEVKNLVQAADLQLTAGGDAEKELNWMLSYADRIDPLTAWRTDIARVKAVRAGEPCSTCGKVHSVPDAADEPAEKENEGGAGNDEADSSEVSRDS